MVTSDFGTDGGSRHHWVCVISFGLNCDLNCVIIEGSAHDVSVLLWLANGVEEDSANFESKGISHELDQADG